MQFKKRHFVGRPAKALDKTLTNTGLVFGFVLGVACSLLASLSNAETAAANRVEFIGRAYDATSGDLLYSEHHNIGLGEQGQYASGEVQYYDADNKPIAQKSLDYRQGQTLPVTDFKELDSTFMFRVSHQRQGLWLEYRDELEQFQEWVELPNEQSPSNEPESFAVIDAGFDRLVAAHWDRLIAGEAVVFSFLAVTRGAFYEFRLSIDDSSANVAATTHDLVLKLEPNNRIFRWLLDPAYLTYDKNTRRLMRFEGLTNIRKRVNGKPQDENYVAVIQYDYL